MKHRMMHGFTIVEMMAVIVMLGMLASMTLFVFGSWQTTAAKTDLKSNLKTVAAAMDATRNFSDGYPSTIPSTYNPSENIVIEMTVAAVGEYCLNAYHLKQTSQRMSISSTNTEPQVGLCPGATNGSTVGGTVPTTPLGVNLAPDMSTWTRTGTATYNSTNQELTLGTSGTAVSPKTRVNGATSIAIDGLFSATTQSANTSLQPDGGWHINISYFGSNGTTPVANTAGYTGNGCARKVALGGSWSASVGGVCGFALGNGITYVTVTLYSSASGYASTTLKVKQPRFTAS